MKYFHHLTSTHTGLLVDNRWGGIRRDLSTASFTAHSLWLISGVKRIKESVIEFPKKSGKKKKNQ